MPKLGVLLTTLLLAAGCSQSAHAPAKAASVNERPSFTPTWLPSYLQPPGAAVTPQYLTWQGPEGASGTAQAESFVLTGAGGVRLGISVVSEAVFSSAYWQTFNSSSTYAHLTLGQSRVALQYPKSANETATAICQSRGYILQLTSTAVPETDLKHVIAALTWKS